METHAIRVAGRGLRLESGLTDHFDGPAGALPGCPLIGLLRDPSTRLETASHVHRCFARAKPTEINLLFQSEICLTTAYPHCGRYTPNRRPGDR